MKQIINHFTDNDLYTFTCMYYVLQKYPRAETEYSFFDRNRTCYTHSDEPLIPVLRSPLLGIHVSVIMMAYVLLFCTLVCGIAAEVQHRRRGDHSRAIGQLHVASRLMLYPALMLLMAGIFIGAVWANVSWGRYWGWDPKEVWVLITMLIYAAPLHSRSMPWFARPMALHRYCILAFLTVLMTYFGVNYLLGGIHSYA